MIKNSQCLLVAFALSASFSSFASELFLHAGEDATIQANEATHVSCGADSNYGRCRPEQADLALRIYRDCRASMDSPGRCATLVRSKFPRGASCESFASACYDDCRASMSSVSSCTSTCFDGNGGQTLGSGREL